MREPAGEARHIFSRRRTIRTSALLFSLLASSIASADGIKLETEQFSTMLPESVSEGGELTIPVLGQLQGPVLVTLGGKRIRVGDQSILQVSSKFALNVRIVGVRVTAAAKGACPKKPEAAPHLIPTGETPTSCLYLQRGNVDWVLAETSELFTVLLGDPFPNANLASWKLVGLQGSLGLDRLEWKVNDMDSYTEVVYSEPERQSSQLFLDIDPNTASYADLLRERIEERLCIDARPEWTGPIINSLRAHLRLYVDETEVPGASFAWSPAKRAICLNIPGKMFGDQVLDRLASAIKDGMAATVSVRSVDAGSAPLRTFSAKKLSLATQTPHAYMLSEGKVVTRLNPVRPLKSQFDELCLDMGLKAGDQANLGSVLAISASNISVTSRTGKPLVTFQQSGVVQFVRPANPEDDNAPPALRNLLQRSAPVAQIPVSRRTPARPAASSSKKSWYCAPMSFEGGATDISLVAVGTGNDFPEGELQVRLYDVSRPVASLDTGAIGYYDVRHVKTMSWVGTGVVATNSSLSGSVPQSFFAIRGHIPLIGAWVGAPRTFTIDGELGTAGTVGFGSEDTKSAIGGGIGFYSSMCMRVPRSQVSRACILGSLDGLATNPSGDRVKFGLAASVILAIGFSFQP